MMNVVFITLVAFDSILEHNIYSDLLREFIKNGHNVMIFCATEKTTASKCELIEETNLSKLFHVRTGIVQKTNVIRKGINTLMLDKKMKSAIKNALHDKKIDLVIYTTPPTTLVKTISFLKKKLGAKTYLLLKDIFPQNSVDLGMLKKKGLKGLIYRRFRNIETKLYKLSDYIGCMSKANVNYLLSNNSFLNLDTVEVCPNCIDLEFTSNKKIDFVAIKKQYSIPENKKLLVYGGNLGKPQGVDYLISCIELAKKNDNYHFVIIGDGTEFEKINSYSKSTSNLTLIKRIPNNDYRSILCACDIALIFLDHRFTIPNFPSRLLDYMSCGLPIVACTDKNTDIGEIITSGGFGYWCESVNPNDFLNCIDKVENFNKNEVIKLEKELLEKEFSSKVAYKTLIRHFA